MGFGCGDRDSFSERKFVSFIGANRIIPKLSKREIVVQKFLNMERNLFISIVVVEFHSELL